MRKIIILLILFVSVAGRAQTITDTGALRSYINTFIVSNSTRAITASNFNTILNGFINVSPNDSISITQGVSNDTLFFWRRKAKAFYVLLRVGAGTPLAQYASLTDVSLTTLSDGQLVKWNAGTSKWNNFTIDKTFIGLPAVENTALSSWAGSGAITHLGTVAVGIWNGSPVADNFISSSANWNAKQNAITLGTSSQYFKGDLTLGNFSPGTVGLGNVQNVDQTNAANLSSGSVPAGRFGNATIGISAINATGGSSASYLQKNGTWSDPATGVTAYSALTDVAITSIAAGQLTHWNAGTSKWNNFTPGLSDVTGWLGYTPMNPTGTTLQYFRGNGSLGTFPTALSSFTNDPGFLAGIVAPAAGGSGLSSYTPYSLLAAGTTSTGNYQQVGVGTTGQVLTSNGPGALPTMQAPPTSSSYSALADVAITSIAAGQLTHWNAGTSKWNNFTPGLTDVVGWLGYTPMNPTGTTLQYFKGNGTLGTFPTTVSFFVNDVNYINRVAPLDSLGRSGNGMQLSGQSVVPQTADSAHPGFISSVNEAYLDSLRTGKRKSKILIGHAGNGSWGMYANATGDTLFNKTDTASGGLTLATRPDSSRLWGIDLTRIMDLTSAQTASGKTFTSPQLNSPLLNTTSVIGQYWIATNTSGGGAWGTAASGISGVGTFSSSSILNGGTISGTNLVLAVADSNNVGLLSTTGQAIKGPKTFVSALTANNTVTMTGLTAGSKTDSAVTQDAAGNLHHKAAFYLDSSSIHQGYVPAWDTTTKTFKMQVNGTGSPNSSVGSGLKLAIAGTNNIKSVTSGIGIKLDSAVSGQVNTILDTGYAVTLGSAQVIPGAKTFSGNIKLPSAIYAMPSSTTKIVTVDSLTGDVRHIGYMNIDTSGIANGAFVKWDSTHNKFVVNSAAGAGTVTVFSANDISGFATQGVTASTTAPVLTYTLVNSPAHRFWGNFTGSTGLASYSSPTLASADFANQGTTAGLLHGNAAGNPSWGPASLVTDVTGLLQAAQFPALSGDISNTAGSTVTAIGTGKVTNNMLAGNIDLSAKVINILSGANGGDGVNNGSTTETRGGNVTFSGANNVTFTTTAPTSVTLPVSGTLLNTTGSGSSLSGIAVSIGGTANQVIASAPTGAITLSLPQSIGTGNAPTFSGATLNGTVKIADGTQGAGKFLLSDASGNASWSTPPAGANVFTAWQVISSGTSGTMTASNAVFEFPSGASSYTLTLPTSPVDGQTGEIYAYMLSGHQVTSFVMATTAGGGISMTGLTVGSSSTSAVALATGDHYHCQYNAGLAAWFINKN